MSPVEAMELLREKMLKTETNEEFLDEHGRLGPVCAIGTGFPIIPVSSRQLKGQDDEGQGFIRSITKSSLLRLRELVQDPFDPKEA